MSITDQLPAILAGPILRRLEATRLCFWLALSADKSFRLDLALPDGRVLRLDEETPGVTCHRLPAGRHLVYLLVDISLQTALPQGQKIPYTMALKDPQDGDWQPVTDSLPHLCYGDEKQPFFVLKPQIGSLLHGSCRKPHHPGADGLVVADNWLAAQHKDDASTWPSALVMSGDQIYADDVAGPMLVAIHQAMTLLGLHDENLRYLESDGLPDSGMALIDAANSLYQREAWLPADLSRADLWQILFGGVEKPVFTSDHAHNHLFTLAEVLAMYLLVWSPVLWDFLDIDTPPQALSDEHRSLYDRELPVIRAFADDLPQVQRLLAHLPTAMIFDDHDVTDDWNLTRAWEEAAYNHPLSRRILGNALIGYLINQGWGNDPDSFDDDQLSAIRASLAAPGSAVHEETIEDVFRFEGWHYTWPTEPGLVVLDTRTRRWRSEDHENKPSGLLDWEAVTDLQRDLRGRDAVILVSAAPIFGVKMIEAVQRFFTLIGKPLMVDAEYWMAHKGTASAILNIFRHRKTPSKFTVLSGDVHYSFVYDVALRHRRKNRQNHTEIWQISSSGFKNEFPPALLRWFDIANRWLFHPKSPLNWFTKRRHMRITPRKPVLQQAQKHPAPLPPGQRLLSASGMGLVTFDPTGRPTDIIQLLPGNTARFDRQEDEATEE